MDRKLILSAIVGTHFALAGCKVTPSQTCRTCKNFFDLGGEGNTHCALDDMDNNQTQPDDTCASHQPKGGASE